MTHVVAFVTQKGGSGKSTTAASVAVAAFEQGKKVFLLELDRQGTLTDWYEARKAEEGPDFDKTDASDLEKAIPALSAAKYDLVTIDTPGDQSGDACGRSLPHSVPADRARSQGLPADGAESHAARQDVRFRPYAVPFPLPAGRRHAIEPR